MYHYTEMIPSQLNFKTFSSSNDRVKYKHILKKSIVASTFAYSLIKCSILVQRKTAKKNFNFS